MNNTTKWSSWIIRCISSIWKPLCEHLFASYAMVTVHPGGWQQRRRGAGRIPDLFWLPNLSILTDTLICEPVQSLCKQPVPFATQLKTATNFQSLVSAAFVQKACAWLADISVLPIPFCLGVYLRSKIPLLCLSPCLAGPDRCFRDKLSMHHKEYSYNNVDKDDLKYKRSIKDHKDKTRWVIQPWKPAGIQLGKVTWISGFMYSTSLLQVKIWSFLMLSVTTLLLRCSIFSLVFLCSTAILWLFIEGPANNQTTK